ncbi:hypothetical protein CARUB_v10012661mg [Capsella rubella]|uniref:Uncharacterized protein n=1 Tax=Capsella rubella TaxID=81985 RepID=R0GU48_9BRAS|nr:hypothetical protein CARUB_v10012661mg [Capsella rubella]
MKTTGQGRVGYTRLPLPSAFPDGSELCLPSHEGRSKEQMALTALVFTSSLSFGNTLPSFFLNGFTSLELIFFSL